MLHLLFNRHPETRSNCLAVLQPEDTLLLLEEAVLLAINPDWAPICNSYALQADVEARGLLDLLPDNITIINDQGFVTLTAQHPKIKSWY